MTSSHTRPRPRRSPHLVLLGDSIFDNGAYIAGAPDVASQVRESLPSHWKVTLGAVDGSMTDDIPRQLETLPSDATYLVLSVGGNNALMCVDVLDTPVASSGEALLLLSQVVADFEASYRKMIGDCLAKGLPLVVCTIYNGNFPDPDYQTRVTIALAVFNDVIFRVSIENHLEVIELRLVCSSPEDFANPIEPSAIGGAKIARAITLAVTERPAP